MFRESSKCLKVMIMGFGLLGLIACQDAKEGSKVRSVKTVKMAENRSAKHSENITDTEKAALVNVELGLGYLAQGQVARAKSRLTHSIKLAPELPETHAAMAYFMERVGDKKAAESELQTAIKLGPKKGAAYNNYGVFLCRQGRYDEADKAFNKALEDKQYLRTAEVYENAGICALKGLKSDNKAKEYLSQAIQHDPKRTFALLELAELYLNQQKPEQTEVLLSQFEKVQEPSARYLWLRYKTANALNDSASMNSHSLKLKNLFEDSPEYQQFLKSKQKS